MTTTPAPLVLMTAGGTGGHVYPALAVASELQARGLRVEWVGTTRGLEHRVVPAAGGLGGYRWGSARKGELLRREGAGK